MDFDGPEAVAKAKEKRISAAKALASVDMGRKSTAAKMSDQELVQVSERVGAWGRRARGGGESESERAGGEERGARHERRETRGERRDARGEGQGARDERPCARRRAWC